MTGTFLLEKKLKKGPFINGRPHHIKERAREGNLKIKHSVQILSKRRTRNPRSSSLSNCEEKDDGFPFVPGSRSSNLLIPANLVILGFIVKVDLLMCIGFFLCRSHDGFVRSRARDKKIDACHK
ncbi:hypothetical protein TNCT_607781 [Trichonephila clavata]|uniref:Transmembrane protein n=1 Tax=Trichonephila clavata TaxID=2740835 RepID=A0A8X6G104_TRICU|nr:hypothetical protein TNCT_607781 [Trichonephila clavata]